MEKLAIAGGQKVRTKPFPTVNDTSGRWIGKEEKELVMQVLDSGHLNRVGGKFVAQFETEFAEKYDAKYAAASSSGTAAIHIAMGALEIGPGDEVITTPITDMGTIIAILLCNAIPIFADVNQLTGNLDAKSIEHRVSERTKGIIAVHLFGQPCAMDEIMNVAKKQNLWLVEDCCQALGAEYKRKKVGTRGVMGCFSFQQSKQMTTGDGGMTITNDEQLARRARLFSDKAWPRDGVGRGHLFLAPNYRMTELQGAVGVAQLGKLDNLIAQRRKTAEKLTSLIKEIPGINPPKIIDGVNHSYWIYSFTIDEKQLGVSSNDFHAALAAEGIPFSLGYIPMPIFEYEVLKDKKTYGKTHCPFDCKEYVKKEIRYRADDYPNALWALSHWLC
ncbi:MAG: DegT/DnrJ/EryC1/StrS family aminotransferase, partial [bacterium]|nr:DegT/DnrJ/EryC1/StrS family aminotransferase [bacterium]